MINILIKNKRVWKKGLIVDFVNLIDLYWIKVIINGNKLLL